MSDTTSPPDTAVLETPEVVQRHAASRCVRWLPGHSTKPGASRRRLAGRMPDDSSMNCTTRPNALNTEALESIGALYRIEETISGANRSTSVVYIARSMRGRYSIESMRGSPRRWKRSRANRIQVRRLSMR
jgi:hypothetical protein